MPKKAAIEKNRKQKPQVRTDFKKSISTEQDFSQMRNVPWETDLLNVYGKKISLSHPPLESGSVTMEYGLSPSIIPIQEGVTIKPGRVFGQVTAYDDKITGQTSIIFNAAGGEVDFAPPNLKGVKARGELAVSTLVAERSPEAAPSAEEQPVIDSISLPPLYSDGLEILSPANQPKAEQSMSAPVQAEALSAQQSPDANDTTEISISLAEPMIIEPIEDFRIELKSAEYIKHKNESEPKLKFHQTKLTYKNRSVSPEFETESDRFGLHTKDNFTIALDADTLVESGYEKAQGQNMEANLLLNSDGASIDTFSRDDLVSVKELLQEETAKHEESLDSRESLPPEREITQSDEQAASDNAVMRIGNASFYLYNTKSENGNIVSAEKCECYHNSFDIKLQGIRLNGRSTLSGSVESITLLTNPDVKILCENLICDEVNGVHTDSALLKRGEKQYALKDVTLDETEQISAKTVQAEIDGYHTTLHNAAIQSYGRIAYESAEVETVLHFGLNKKDKNSKYDDSARAFFTFRLGNGYIINDRFGSGTQALQLAGQQKYTEKQIGSDQAKSDNENIAAKDKRTAQKITGDIFTDDGFLQLEDAKFDFANDGDDFTSIRGTGSFRFLKIPYDITVPGKKGVGSASHIKGNTQEKQEHENETDFTIDNDGKINAKLGNFVQLPMLKGKNESESIIKTLTLNDAAINDSVLTAKSVRIDRGFNLQQDIEDNTESETAKKLFGMGLSGTIADVGGSAKLSRDEGIIGETEKKQLGRFAVSDFLGFLDVSGDYATGTLHAGLHAGAEKSRDNTQKLVGESKKLTDAGISIPIAGPLSFEFSAGTSLEIGGELSADLARIPQQSFGEEMKPDETMALGGSLNISGLASVNISAGVAAGVSALVTNLLAADIKLNAELGADFDTELTGGTALGKENEKLKQVDDLSINGALDVTLSGALSLSSDVKFLIWKANIFTIELGKKEIKLAQFSGTVTREAGAEGIKNGWHFESLDLSAEAFGKKAGLALKNQKPAKPEPIEVTKEAAEVIGNDALGAWAVLEDLKRQQSLGDDRVYFMDKAEQTALNDKIKTMTATVKEKLEKYVFALTEYEKRLVKEEEAAAEAVKTARDEQSKYQRKDEIRQIAIKQAKIGGFNLENYRQEQEQELLSEKKEPENALSKEEKAKIREENKSIRAENKLREKRNDIIREKNKMLRQMASADFAIARQVGIYNDAMTMAKDSYDTFAQAENMKLKAKSKDIPQENLYQMSSEMSDSDFLYKEHKFWGTGADEMQRLSSFGGKGDSYFKSLYTNAINSAHGREREGFGIYRKVFRVHSDPGSDEKSQIRNMSGYDLLKIILTDRYPNGACDSDGNDRSGKVIGATPDDKLKALKYLFNENSTEGLTDAFARKVIGFEKEKTKQQTMVDDSDRIYEAIFDTTMQNMTAKGNVDIDKKLLELNKNLEESREKYLQTVQEHLDAQAALVKVRAQQDDCHTKLNSLEKNVETGIALRGEAVDGAIGAVDFMEKDFSDINSGKRLMEAVSEHKESQEILKSAGATS